MKKYLNKLFVASAAFTMLTACNDADFGDTNKNTNQVSSVVPSSLLVDAQANIGNIVTTNIPSIYVQHLSQTQYTEESRYQTIHWSYGNLYNRLLSLKTIIDVNSNPETAEAMAAYGSNNNQIAVAKILRAYYFQYMTDRWGNIPYSEALQGLDNPQPKYDSQEFIYDSLFNEIDEALAMMDAGAGPVGDIYFDGDMTRWAQFANTLKLVMALRLSKVHPDPNGYAATKFREALPGAISSTAENIYHPFISDENFDNPWQDDFVDSGRTDECMSDVIVDFMLDRNDPRIEKYAAPAVSSGEYVGMPYGIANAGDIPNDDVSFMNDALIKDPTFPGVVFTYAQVAFSKAEAVELGWISGDTQTFYEEAITSSMEQWGVDQADIAAYLAEPNVAFDANNAMNLIAEQKWLALFYQGFEAWFEWRRLDYPNLSPAPDALTGTGIPVRHGYPDTEPAQNAANYNAAVSEQGPDNMDTPVWWDR